MRLLSLLIALLLLPVAAAQSGPAPGYDSATHYAAAYLEGQVDEAAGDPAGYAGDHASAEAVQAEAEHALYVPCWAADDQDVQAEACDAYYTPRGQAAPEQPPQEMEPAVQETEYLVNEATGAADDLAEETLDAAEDLVDDPTGVAAFVERMAGATERFLERIVDAVTGFVSGIGGLLGDIGAIGPLAAETGLGIADGMLDASGVAIDGLGAAGRGATDGMASAGRVTGDGIATAGQAIGDAVQAAASTIQATVSGWFGGDTATETLPALPEAPVAVPLDDGGLLDDVTHVLE